MVGDDVGLGIGTTGVGALGLGVLGVGVLEGEGSGRGVGITRGGGITDGLGEGSKEGWEVGVG
jgi:hypothetical protein